MISTKYGKVTFGNLKKWGQSAGRILVEKLIDKLSVPLKNKFSDL